jgi:glutamate carboxypeptidase
MPSSQFSKELLRSITARLPEMVSTLRRFVVAESPSLEKQAADRCCGVIASEWRNGEFPVERVVRKGCGDLLRVAWWPYKSRPHGQLLVLGHYDTVYATGTLKKMPFRVSGGKAYGPGTFDMKAGIVQALFALDALQRSAATLRKRLVFLWTSDEEIGSDASRGIIESEARRSDAVFVLEPSFGPRGLLKTSRKGVGEVEIIAHGRASHAGLAPHEGINAVNEMVHQLARVAKWNGVHRDSTIAACIVEGGTRSNVIPAEARAVLDLRALKTSDMRTIEKRFRSLRPILPGSRIEVRGGFNRAPMERKVSSTLFAHAKSIAHDMGISLGECSVGGGSDGNLTAALGIPTIDGLGAVGDGAHSTHEHIQVRTMPQRAALLAALLATC